MKYKAIVHLDSGNEITTYYGETEQEAFDNAITNTVRLGDMDIFLGDKLARSYRIDIDGVKLI